MLNRGKKAGKTMRFVAYAWVSYCLLVFFYTCLFLATFAKWTPDKINEKYTMVKLSKLYVINEIHWSAYLTTLETLDDTWTNNTTLCQ